VRGCALLLALALTVPARAGDEDVPAPPVGMVLVPAGESWIGDDKGDPNEGPRRKVAVHAFFLDRTEVSNEAYARFVVDTDREAPGTGVDWARRWAWVDGEPRTGTAGDPVFLVTWADADAYCAWAGKRLPTELEWERAARGDDGRRWSFGDSWADRETRVNWFDGDGHPDGHAHVAPAESYAEGPFGTRNMTGNVWEWVAEPYMEQPWRADAAATDFRVVRGGSWYTNNWYWMRASFRYFLPADEVSTIYGFRCAGDVAQERSAE
jgi:eukaryotic-like serine/threonine-protein kinase